jgi:hypothetical protein
MKTSLESALTILSLIPQSIVNYKSAKNNSWTKATDETGKPHLPLDRAKAIYDDFAQAQGFTQGTNSNWYKPL